MTSIEKRECPPHDIVPYVCECGEVEDTICTKCGELASHIEHAAQLATKDREIEDLKEALIDSVAHVADWIDSQVLGTVPSRYVAKITSYVRRHGGSPAAIKSADLEAWCEAKIDKLEQDLADCRAALKAAEATIEDTQTTCKCSYCTNARRAEKEQGSR